ncbi:MAG: twin-arginine translocase subunit TatC [Flavobacteriales bacterium]|nr:twin-arginine translocase subunit TatC [Flavobacteriales bacterium]
MKKDEKEMSFLGHLEALRKHLMRIIIAVVIFAFLAFLNKSIIFDQILFAPKNTDFITYKLLCKLSQITHLDESLCISEMPFTIQSRTMSGQFSAHLWISIIAGFIIAFPYILFELWRFISPALYEEERKNAKGFIFVASFLFLLGVGFGYYVITPLSMNFLGNYTVSEAVINEFDLGSYIELIVMSVLSCGIVFELPIVVYFFTRIGLVTPTILRQFRKYALIVILLVSAIITPPDISSQILVSIPILILYEISILISGLVLKKDRKNTSSLTTK